MVATPSNLTIRYVPSQDFANATTSTSMTVVISPIPDHQFGTGSFNNSDHSESLPGLDVSLSGNVIDQGSLNLAYTGDAINGFNYYNLTVEFAGALGDEVPELVLGFKKTTPPTYNLYVD